jgi:hypothetical protein
MSNNAMKNAEEKKRLEVDNARLKKQLELIGNKKDDKKKCCSIF